MPRLRSFSVRLVDRSNVPETGRGQERPLNQQASVEPAALASENGESDVSRYVYIIILNSYERLFQKMSGFSRPRRWGIKNRSVFFFKLNFFFLN